MSAFGGLILTNRGRNLQAKTQAGAELKYTRIALGDGSLGTTPIVDLTTLKNQVMALPIHKLKVLTEGRALIGTVLSNQELNTGFYFRELGIFALDPDLGEVLYCYGNSGSLAEYIPAGGGPDIIEKNIDIQTLVGNTKNVSAIINNSLVYATENELRQVESSLRQSIENISIPVTSVNEKTGDIVLSAADVGAVSQNDFNLHQKDYVRQPGYGVTAGSANTYTLTLDPALTSYTAGVGITVKIHAANTGASTININGLGAKSIRDSKGNALTAGKLMVNGVYTLRYDGTNFILQGEGGSGNATASDLLSGKTASTDAGDILGTMPNRGAVTITPSNIDQAIVSGYHSGAGKVLAVPVPAANVLTGTVIAGTAGTMPNRGAVNATISSEGGQYTIPAGYHNGVGKVTADYLAGVPLSALEIMSNLTNSMDVSAIGIYQGNIYVLEYTSSKNYNIKAYTLTGSLLSTKAVTLADSISRYCRTIVGGVFCTGSLLSATNVRRYNINGTLLRTATAIQASRNTQWLFNNGYTFNFTNSSSGGDPYYTYAVANASGTQLVSKTFNDFNSNHNTMLVGKPNSVEEIYIRDSKFTSDGTVTASAGLFWLGGIGSILR